jgi:hypothetical protein
MNPWLQRRRCAALVLLGLPILPASAFAAPGVAERWNDVFAACVKVETLSPCLASRNLAILHAAIHDAWHAGNDRHPPLLARGAEALRAPVEPSRAAEAAGHAVCLHLFPSQSARLDAARLHVAAHADQSLGKAIAASALAARAGDGATVRTPYIPQSGPGQWRRTTRNRPPELPHWGQVQPFVLRTPQHLRPPPPPAPDSPEFARALREVEEWGGRESHRRTAHDEETARFWSDFSYTSTPPGHWNQIARDVCRRQSVAEADAVRLFALLNLALADAAIAAWDAKFAHHFWRPVTALQATGRPSWTSLLPSPSHPEYVSGHACFSGAAAFILGRWFPSADAKGIRFQATSDALPGVVRIYDDFDACAREISRSRVLAGIHFSFSGQAGLDLGRRVAEQVWARHAE